MMQYPLVLSSIYNGLTVYIPDPQRTKQTYETLLQANPQTPFPFWAQTWPSAYALATFLTQEPEWVTNKTVLELGAGIGLPSLVAATFASHVIISDHAEEAVQLAAKNIDLLGLTNATAQQLDWNELPTNLHADVLLLSDLNYSSGSFEPLLQLVRHFIQQGAVIIITTPQRINITPFAEALQPLIKRSELRYANETGIRLVILRE